MNEQIRQKLLEMIAEDERVRDELARTGELFDGYCPKMEKVHVINAEELEKLIDQNTWLGESMVGMDGAEAAWRIVQHSISRPEFQRKCLRLIEKAVAAGDAEAYQFAYLHDRICFFENRPQRYGTHSDWNESGKMEVWKLEDKDKVNEYRTEIGLKPLKSLTWEMDETRENKPKDWRKRQDEFLKWTKETGWRK
ncbi:MAG: hypothetical protein LC778_15405 [Acidobacteria bacterium]|nr:hypothetical protein [Acidobacteriota bacterium]